jgi:homoserine O-acetyltransferase
MPTFQYKNTYKLENGSILPEFHLEYQTWGTLNADQSNVVWVCHALTANADAVDWWPGLIGTDCLFNPDEHYIICANMLGSCYGSSSAMDINPLTGEPYFHDFPVYTIRDIVGTLELLRQHLQIKHIEVLLGGSMGGQQALEWAILKPDIFTYLIPIATNSRHSSWGIAFNESQRLALAADPTWKERRVDAGHAGLKAARSIAMLSYRHYDTYVEFQTEEDTSKLEHFRATTYQSYQGDKLVKRFNAFAYYYLSKAMDSHNVGRGKAGIEEALSLIKAKTLVIAISSDLLFPQHEQEFLAKHIPAAKFMSVDSRFGHDGFLIETEALSSHIQPFIQMKKSAANGSDFISRAATILI